MIRAKTAKFLLGAGLLFLAGCLGPEPDIDGGGAASAARQGKKGKKTYVAVGNSLTAGFQNNGLRRDWQESGYPALIARAMGVGDFQLPLIDTPGIGLQRIQGQPATPLMLEGSAIVAKPLSRPLAELLLNAGLDRPYNDLGVPGTTTLDFLRAYNSATSQSPNNPFFNIILRGERFGNATMLRQAALLDPDVMTLWIGNNDILGGLTSGTVVEGSTVTPVAAYSAMMDLALDTLLRETRAHIFIANIPSAAAIPYVTTLPKVVIGPDFRPVLAEGDPVPLLTQESEVEYVLFPALAAFGRGIGIPAALGGTGQPLPANLTLTKAEAETAARLTEGYNAYLQAKASAHPKRLTLVDANRLMLDLKEGRIPGLTGRHPLLDPSGSAYSLDGIHPNSKGYLQVANLFIDAINRALHKKYRKYPAEGDCGPL